MGCTISQAPYPALCTPGVVYDENPNVHHVYMSKKRTSIPVLRARRTRKIISQETLRWRETRISEWRTANNGMTQQQMADALAEEGIDLDRVSVGRIEAGTQMPLVETIEAMARILKTDVDSMLNLSPEDAKAIQQFRKLDPKDQRRALRHLEVGGDE